MIQSIPYGEFLRAKRNCSSKEGYDKEKDIMMRRFRDRGYSSKCINLAAERAASRTREELLVERNKQQSEGEKVRFITQYNADSRNISFILRKHWSILKTDAILGEIVGPQPQVTFKKGKSLKDRLSRNEVTSLAPVLSACSGFFMWCVQGM